MRPAARRRFPRALLLVSLAATLIVQRRALGSFFGSDDLIHLEQAAGLAPTPHVPWRVLSQVVYFRAMLAGFGPNALAFFTISLAVHLLNVALLAWLGHRLELPRRATFMAAFLFGTHPLFAAVLSHAVMINDMLSGSFMLLAAILCLESGRAGVMAVTACYAVAILCKESVLTLPVALTLLAAHRQGRRAALSRLTPALVLMAGVAVAFFMSRPRGLAPAGAPYEIHAGFNLFHAYMTFLSWAADLIRPIPDQVRSFDTGAWRVGLPLLAGLAACAVAGRGRGRTVWLGLAWWTAALLPVLPLVHSTYAHYMYVASAGLALSVAAAIEWGLAALGRFGRWPRVGRVVAIIVLFLYASWCDDLIQRRWQARVQGVDLPLDPSLRSVEVARHAVLGAAETITGDSRRVAILIPWESYRVLGARSGHEYRAVRPGARPYELLSSVLDRGRALRLFFPQVDTVRFVHEWTPELVGYDLFMAAPGEYLVGAGHGPEALLRVTRRMLMNGWRDAALRQLANARLAYPDDPGIAAALAAVRRDEDSAAARPPGPQESP